MSGDVMGAIGFGIAFIGFLIGLLIFKIKGIL